MGRHSKQIDSVQALRAVAAAAVVLHHTLSVLVRNAGYSFVPWESGAAGVDLFFCISGFVMIYVHASDFQTPGASLSFFSKRAIRIAPLYWIVTAAMVATMLVVPTAFSTLRLDWINAALSCAFLLSRTSNGDVGTLVPTGWSLCFEAYFYVVFALLLNLPRRYFLGVLAIVFGFGVALGCSALPIPPAATVMVRPLILEFLFGIVIGLAFLKGKSMPLPVSLFAAGASAILIAIATPGGDWQRLAVWGIPCSVILASALAWERYGLRMPRWSLALGASSYSIYLVHHFVVSLITKAWGFAHLSYLPAILPGIAAFAAALALGHVTFVWIEKPLLVQMRKLLAYGFDRKSGFRAALTS